jgi:hypothetical protein
MPPHRISGDEAVTQYAQLGWPTNRPTVVTCGIDSARDAPAVVIIGCNAPVCCLTRHSEHNIQGLNVVVV